MFRRAFAPRVLRGLEPRGGGRERRGILGRPSANFCRYCLLSFFSTFRHQRFREHFVRFTVVLKNDSKYKVLDSKVLDHEDIFFGKTKILKDMLVISVKNAPFKVLEVSYQGCSEKGFCYPIQKVNIS